MSDPVPILIALPDTLTPEQFEALRDGIARHGEMVRAQARAAALAEAAERVRELEPDWCDTHEVETVHRAAVLAILEDR